VKERNSQAMVKTYLAVFGALAVLTALTVTVSYMRLARAPAISLAVLIALVKASLITAFFMHLKFEGRLIYGILFVSLFFFFVLIVPVLIDIGF
jgi:cytochrome c oxidase subunit 4